MNRSSIRWVIVLGWGLSLFAAFSGAALSQPCEQWIGKMVSVQGTVEARKAGDSKWLPVSLNDTFCPGDTIRVGSKSRADLTLSNQSVLRPDENSEFTLEGVKEESAAKLNMLKGAAHFFSRTPRGLEVQTPYTIAGVRGTEFMLRIEEGRTLLTVFEGSVLAQNTAGNLTLQSGQSAVAEAGKAPVLRTVAPIPTSILGSRVSFARRPKGITAVNPPVFILRASSASWIHPVCSSTNACKCIYVNAPEEVFDFVP